jgi:hypothetical protein
LQLEYGRRKGTQFILWNQDLVYLRFLGNYQGGFYISGGIRYTYIYTRRDYNNFKELLILNLPTYSGYVNNRNIGMMMGFGFLHFSHSGFYYGIGLELGLYLHRDKDIDLEGVDMITNGGGILDVDLLKIGFTF